MPCSRCIPGSPGTGEARIGSSCGAVSRTHTGLWKCYWTSRYIFGRTVQPHGGSSGGLQPGFYPASKTAQSSPAKPGNWTSNCSGSGGRDLPDAQGGEDLRFTTCQSRCSLGVVNVALATT